MSFTRSGASGLYPLFCGPVFRAFAFTGWAGGLELPFLAMDVLATGFLATGIDSEFKAAGLQSQ
jgi:hypothetical protein